MAIFSNISGRAAIRIAIWALTIAGIAVPQIAFAQCVEERRGSVYLITDGHETRLTHDNDDMSPALSADGRYVTYTRTYKSDEAGEERAVSEIRIHNLITRADEMVLSGPVEIDRAKRSGFGSPEFSADGSTVYFLFDWSVTTHGLASLDLRSHKVRFLMPAVSFASVLRGEYAGDLVVQQRRSKLGGGFYYLHYLFTPDGREIGVVGESDFDVGLFLDPDGLSRCR